MPVSNAFITQMMKYFQNYRPLTPKKLVLHGYQCREFQTAVIMKNFRGRFSHKWNKGLILLKNEETTVEIHHWTESAYCCCPLYDGKGLGCVCVCVYALPVYPRVNTILDVVSWQVMEVPSFKIVGKIGK